jgi:small subunit ribosomal protein S18
LSFFSEAGRRVFTRQRCRLPDVSFAVRGLHVSPWRTGKAGDDLLQVTGAGSDFMKKFKGPPKRRSNKNKVRAKKKDPIFVEGKRPRPMYVDYKDLDLLTKLTNRQGKIVGRRKSGCTAASQHAVTLAVKRARYMALLPYVGD